MIWLYFSHLKITSSVIQFFFNIRIRTIFSLNHLPILITHFYKWIFSYFISLFKIYDNRKIIFASGFQCIRCILNILFKRSVIQLFFPERKCIRTTPSHAYFIFVLAGICFPSKDLKIKLKDISSSVVFLSIASTLDI